MSPQPPSTFEPGPARLTGDRLAVFGDRLDRLMTVEVRPLDGGLPPGIVVPTYLACRDAQGEPSSTLAARKLAAAVKPGSHLIIATGAGVPPRLPHGETDGPPGAVALAHAIACGLGANVTLLAQEEHLPAVSACACIARQTVSAGRLEVARFPAGDAAGQAFAGSLLDRLQATAVVFVERDGPNDEGHYHGIRGDRRPPGSVADVFHLADEAARRGILTVGIGDGGNEVGFGKIKRQVETLLPDMGRVPGLAGTVVTRTAADILVTASVSNWGAYAVVAALAALLDRPEIAHTGEREHAFITACAAAGARDGATGLESLAVDGISWQGHAGVAELMRAITLSACAPRNPADPDTADPVSPLSLLAVLEDAKSNGGYHL